MLQIYIPCRGASRAIYAATVRHSIVPPRRCSPLRVGPLTATSNHRLRTSQLPARTSTPVSSSRHRRTRSSRSMIGASATMCGGAAARRGRRMPSPRASARPRPPPMGPFSSSVNKPRGLNDPAARADGTVAPGGTCHTGGFCHCDGRSRATPAVEVIAVSDPVMPRPGSRPRKPLLLACAASPAGSPWPCSGCRYGPTGTMPDGCSAARYWSSPTPDARPDGRTRPSRWCCGTTRTHERPSSAPPGARAPTGFATARRAGRPGAARARVVHPAAPVPLR